MKISLNFVPMGPIDNKSSLVRVMAWRQTGDKPLPRTNDDTFQSHIYASPGLPQWVDNYIFQKYLSDPLNHIHIWQVSPQHSCGDTCQIWMWYSTGILLILKNWQNNRTEEIVSVPPTHPGAVHGNGPMQLKAPSGTHFPNPCKQLHPVI